MRGGPGRFNINAGARFAAAKGVAARRNFAIVFYSAYERFEPPHLGAKILCAAIL